MKRAFLAFILVVLPAFAQQKEDAASAEVPKFFHFDFVIKEVEGGKTLNSRAYEMTLSPSAGFRSSSVRAHDKVPVPAANGQSTYVDAGIDIDCEFLRYVDSRVMLSLKANIANAQTPTAGAMTLPLVNETRWISAAVVPVGKPTLVLTADQPSSKRQLQMEVTVKPAP